VKAAFLLAMLALTRVPPSVRTVPVVQATASEPDRDKDRIPDSRDRCPDQPETYNGVDDDDGCPDQGRVITRVCKLEIVDKLYFAAQSAVLNPEGLSLLQAIASTLRGNPQVTKLEVRGHQVAGEHGGVALARARAVVADLVGRGVTTELVVKDLGRTQPSCPHAGDCRDQSRRVEFAIVGRSVPAAAR
jgi:OOP family OmpA-OmpF porin